MNKIRAYPAQGIDVKRLSAHAFVHVYRTLFRTLSGDPLVMPSKVKFMNYIYLIFVMQLFLAGAIAEETRWDPEHAKYADKNRNVDLKFESKANELLFTDKNFVETCWSTVSPESFFLYYTVDIEGKPSDVKWFPKDSPGDCVKKKIMSVTFPKPTETMYIELFVWDGAGG